MSDRLDYPATGRNLQPLVEVLRPILRQGDRVLEVASGSGQHAVGFTEALDVHWQPSSYEAQERASIDAWSAGRDRIAPALNIDVTARPWPVALGAYDALFCANMIHIAPWACTPALFDGAAHAVRPGGMLLLYGPFDVPWRAMAPSNLRFHASLKSRNASWGIRSLDAVSEEGNARGFELVATHEMPANNLTLAFQFRS